MDQLRLFSLSATARRVAWVLFAGLLPLLSPAARAQNADAQQPPAPATAATDTPAAPQQAPAPAADAQSPAAPPEVPSVPAQPAAAAPTPPDTKAAQPAAAKPPVETGITEEEIKRLIVGKDLFLRGGFLDNNLNFNEHGQIIGNAVRGSYTLSDIRIDRVHLTKHKVELEGQRFGLHFLGALPTEDPTKAVDRVQITTKKKFVRISIDREIVIKPKKEKDKDKGKEKEKGKSKEKQPGIVVLSKHPDPIDFDDKAPKKHAAPAPDSASSAPAANAQTPPATDPSQKTPASGQIQEYDDAEIASAAAEAQAAMAAAPPEERPADIKSVTTTTSPAHSTKVLKDALDNIFAQGFDERMMAAMPDFWKLYYEAAAAKSDYRPKDTNVLRQSQVDKKARIVSALNPPSNQFAQDNGVAGMALYHVVVGTDGKPGEISVARPIGFGLDESAVNTIRRAKFEPASKDGKPVPVLLDLIVEFRIYSNLTNTVSKQTQDTQTKEPILPGPYSVQH